MAKTPTDIRSLARGHTVSALNTLASIMNSDEAPAAARVSAAQSLLDRGWGKPTQTVDMNVRKIARELTDDELASIAAGSGDGTAQASVDPQQLN